MEVVDSIQIYQQIGTSELGEEIFYACIVVQIIQFGPCDSIQCFRLVSWIRNSVVNVNLQTDYILLAIIGVAMRK